MLNMNFILVGVTDLVALSMVAIGAVRREKICEMQLK